jgi:hypothetical protein
MAATPNRQKATADATQLYHHTPAEFRRKLIQLVRAYSTLIQRPGWGRGMSIKRAAPDRRASIRTLSSNSLAIRSSPHYRFSVAHAPNQLPQLQRNRRASWATLLARH